MREAQSMSMISNRNLKTTRKNTCGMKSDVITMLKSVDIDTPHHITKSRHGMEQQNLNSTLTWMVWSRRETRNKYHFHIANPIIGQRTNYSNHHKG